MKRITIFIWSLLLVFFIIGSVSSSYADDIIVAFEQKEYTSLVGKDISIIPVVQGTKQKGKMVYSSSDESIATVNNGRVKGIKAGQVTITCNATVENKSFECSYELTVLQPVKKIEVLSKSIELPTNCKMKESFVHILPEDASNTKLEFTSSNEKVAKISKDGIITTLDEGGSATITCKATDGSNVKATFTVKVPKTAWFFTKDIVIDSPDGVDFYYKPTASSFLSKEYCSNDVVRMSAIEVRENYTTDELPYIVLNSSNHLRKVHLRPLKTGTSKFVFDGFMVNKISVNIKVNRSAVYEVLNYDQCLKNFEKNKGLRFYVKGNFLREESQDGIRSAILFHDGNETKPVKIILAPNDRHILAKEKVASFDVVLSRVEDFVTETGLKKQILVFEPDLALQ